MGPAATPEIKSDLVIAMPSTPGHLDRQAISLAIDRKQLVGLFSGYADTLAGYQVWPSWVTGRASRPVVAQDLARAQSLARQARATGTELRLVVGIGRELLSGEVAEVAADMIRQDRPGALRENTKPRFTPIPGGLLSLTDMDLFRDMELFR